MRGGSLRVLVAVVVLLVLALWLWRPGAKRSAVDRQPGLEASQGARVDLAPAAPEREAVEPPSSVPEVPALTFDEKGPGRYAFDLTVVPIDGSGRPLASVEVRIGLDMHALALLGKTEWNGELHATWRSFEPTVDLVLDARRDSSGFSTLRHVHLIADKPETVRVAVDISSVPVLSGLALLDGAFREHAGESTLDHGAEFKRDSADNGVFVDPSLLRAPTPAVSIVEGDGTTSIGVGNSAFLYQLVSVSAERPSLDLQEHSNVDITVRDEKGDPIPSVWISVMTQAHAARGDSNSSPDGRMQMGVASGPAMVVAGGGVHAIVRQDLNIKDGETCVIEMRCPRLERTRVRLLDRNHQPLAGWHLESRETDGAGSFVDRDDTNAEGRAEVTLPLAGRGQLFVRPYGTSTLPKLRLDTFNLSSNADNDIVLDVDARPATIRTTIIAPDSEIEVRLWNTDSDEGMRLVRSSASEDDKADMHSHVFHAGNLVPGRYVLEIGAACVGWKRVGPFLVASGQEFDAGTYTLEQPAKLKLRGLASNIDAKVTVHTLEHGLYLVGEADVSKGADTLLSTPGEWTLSIKSADAEAPGVLLVPRVIRAQSGRTLALDASESNAPH